MTLEQITGALAPYTLRSFCQIFVSRIIPIFVIPIIFFLFAPPTSLSSTGSESWLAEKPSVNLLIMVVIVVPIYETILLAIPVGLLVVNSTRLRTNSNLQIVMCIVVGCCFAFLHSRPLLYLLHLALFGILMTAILMQHWLLDRYRDALIYCFFAHMLLNLMAVLVDLLVRFPVIQDFLLAGQNTDSDA